MAQQGVAVPTRFGATARRDAWWKAPVLTFLGLSAFVVYSTIVGLTGKYFEVRENTANFSGRAVAPYLSPFYAPLVYDSTSRHAWFAAKQPGWWPAGLAFSAATLILWGPGLFRFTCYYYRKAYYRAFWADPPACAVGEPRKTYWGERRFPLVMQNAHRYLMYVALVFLVLLAWDALQAFWWPVDRAGAPVEGGVFGAGVGTFIMIVNVVLLGGYTLGCHSLRHVVGGRMDCFSCVAGSSGGEKLRAGYQAWKLSTFLNEHHMGWAWASLTSVGLTDLYIRLCAMGIIHDPRLF